MYSAPQPSNSHHEVAVPIIVIAALVVGALGGYAFGLGRAQQMATLVSTSSDASPQTAQTASVGVSILPPPTPVEDTPAAVQAN